MRTLCTENGTNLESLYQRSATSKLFSKPKIIDNLGREGIISGITRTNCSFELLANVERARRTNRPTYKYYFIYKVIMGKFMVIQKKSYTSD